MKKAFLGTSLIVLLAAALLFIRCDESMYEPDPCSLEAECNGPESGSRFCPYTSSTYRYSLSVNDPCSYGSYSGRIEYRAPGEGNYTIILTFSGSSYSLHPSRFDEGDYEIYIIYRNEDDRTASLHRTFIINSRIKLVSPEDSAYIEGNSILLEWERFACEGFDLVPMIFTEAWDTVWYAVLHDSYTSVEVWAYIPEGNYHWTLGLDPNVPQAMEYRLLTFKPMLNQFSPANQAWISDLPIYFRWDEFPDTYHYLFKLWNPGEDTLLSITRSSLNYTCTDSLSEGIYYWQVFACMADTNFPSDIRSFAYVPF